MFIDAIVYLFSAQRLVLSLTRCTSMMKHVFVG